MNRIQVIFAVLIMVLFIGAAVGFQIVRSTNAAFETKIAALEKSNTEKDTALKQLSAENNEHKSTLDQIQGLMDGYDKLLFNIQYDLASFLPSMKPSSQVTISTTTEDGKLYSLEPQSPKFTRIKELVASSVYACTLIDSITQHYNNSDKAQIYDISCYKNALHLKAEITGQEANITMWNAGDFFMTDAGSLDANRKEATMRTQPCGKINAAISIAEKPVDVSIQTRIICDDGAHIYDNFAYVGKSGNELKPYVAK